MRKLCHGDIKTENVLLTGWSWVMLADFASFKPTLLPDVRIGGKHCVGRGMRCHLLS